MPRAGTLVVLAGCLALMSCSGSASAKAPVSTATLPLGRTVTLGQSAFLQTSVTFSAGQTLRLVDPADTGGRHLLCWGQDGYCDPNAQGPELLRGPGLLLLPGATKDIAFLRAGQYHLTCTIHPSMNLTISVLGTG